MFDAVRNNKKIVQIFLALIALPFALWGVDAYVRNADQNRDVATIGDTKITQQQFQQMFRERLERLRAQMGSGFDPKLMDTPEVRRALLDEMIDQRVLLLEAAKSRMVAPDDLLRKALNEIPAFQENGKFSVSRYEELLRAQGMTPAGFEAQMRQDMLLQQLAGVIARSNIPSQTVAERVLAFQGEQREIEEIRFAPEKYLAQVKLADDVVEQYYRANSKEFELPEQARAEYVVLSQEKIAGLASVSDAEIKAWYDSHKSRYTSPEARQASHILLSKEAGKAAADTLLQEVRKNPVAFADLARKHSQDPGSAKQGGSLGFVSRGEMVKPFEEALFRLAKGEISDVVESEFGYHIIRVTEIRPGKEKPLAEVRGEIEGELKKQMAARKFAEAAESFSNLAYEQADSLKPVAEKFALKIETTPWLGRAGITDDPFWKNDRLLQALFSADAVKERRNTEAVEVAPNTLLVARVADYRPAAQRPLTEVAGVIEAKLKRQQAQVLAREAGEAALAGLTSGKQTGGEWSPSRRVSRLQPAGLPAVAQTTLFGLAAEKLPAYAGVEVPGQGYVVYRLLKLHPAEKIADAQRQLMVDQLERLGAQQEIQAYTAALKARYKVRIEEAALETKEK